MKRTSIVRLVAAVLLVTTTSAAFAHEHRPATPPNTPTFADTTTCSVRQNAVIEEAFVEAQRRVERAIAFIDAHPNHEHVRTWFGRGAKLIYVRHSLVRIGEALRPGHRPTVFCGTEACQAFGQAWRGYNTMSVCARFFKALTEGSDARFGVIVHEVSHLIIGTRDHAYGPENARALAERDSHLAATNADNFEYFVEHLPVVPAS